MKAKIGMLLLLMTVFAGCKNEKSVDELEVATPEVDETFKVVVSVVAKADDTFSLFYTEDGSTDFSKIPALWMAFKGSETVQDITYTLPEDVLPTQIRLDFGMSDKQQDIVMKEVKFLYMGREFKIPVNMFFVYFDPDVSKTIYDKQTGVIKAVVKDGVRQSPSFYPNTKPLGEELEKLVKGN